MSSKLLIQSLSSLGGEQLQGNERSSCNKIKHSQSTVFSTYQGEKGSQIKKQKNLTLPVLY